jgi:hypothetical protein
MARFFDRRTGSSTSATFSRTPGLPPPIVITEPAIGYGGGLAGMFVRPRRAGSEGWSRRTSPPSAARHRERNQGAFAADASRWLEGACVRRSAPLPKVNLDFFGLGSDSASLDQKVRYSLNLVPRSRRPTGRSRPSRRGRSVCAMSMPMWIEAARRFRPRRPPRRAAGENLGSTAVLEFDTRDNLFTPTEGVSRDLVPGLARGPGCEQELRRFEQIVMGWLPLPHRITLGARANYAWSSDGRRSSCALSSSSGRSGDALSGREDGLGRGRRAGGLRPLERVVFGGAGSARTDRDAFDGTQNVGSGGVGVRYARARKCGTGVGLDVARSSGPTAVYLVVGNAWFRP